MHEKELNNLNKYLCYVNDFLELYLKLINIISELIVCLPRQIVWSSVVTWTRIYELSEYFSFQGAFKVQGI